MAAELPEELVLEILYRLPAKTVMGLKLVCKSWYRLISDVCAPKFSCAAAANPSGFIFAACSISNYSPEFLEYVSYPNNSGYCEDSKGGFVELVSSLLPFKPCPNRLLDCSHGLLLFTDDVNNHSQYCVCNPTTKQCIVATPGPIQSRPHYRFPRRPRDLPFAEYSPSIAMLAFDPAKSLHFKIVRFLCAVRYYWPTLVTLRFRLKLDVFSSNTGNWVRLELPIKPLPCVHESNPVDSTKHGVYLNGMFYVLSFYNYLLRFQLDLIEKDAPAPTALPIQLPDNQPHIDSLIGVSKGRLHYSSQDETRSIVSIWVLEDSSWKDDDCRPKWRPTHRISIPGLISKHPNIPVGDSKLCWTYAFHPTSNVVILGIPTMLFHYDLDSGELRVALSMRPGRKIYDISSPINFYSPGFLVLKSF